MSSKTKTTATKEEARPALVPKLRFPEFRGAEGWDNAILGDWSEVVRGGSPRPIDGFLTTDANGLNWLKIGDVDKEAKYVTRTTEKVRPEALSKTRVVKPGDLILSNSMSFGRPYILQIETCIHDGWIAITDIAKKADRDFLYYSISAPGSQSYFVDNAAGSGVQNLNADIIKALPVRFPNPAEQKKIAECLSSVDELIAAQVRKLDALKTHKKGLMQQLFPREGETQPRLRFPEFQNAGEWDEGTLSELATFRRGSFPQPYGLPEWHDEINGMPFIQVFDVGDDFRLKDKTKSRISKLGAEKSVFIPEGTLIVTLQGSIGRVAITHYDAYIDRTLLIFESFRKPIETVFFARVIQNLFDIEKEKAPGGIIKTITKEALCVFKVKFPAIDEQQHIADCLTSLDDLITAQTQKLSALKTHKKGLMQQLFPSPQEVES